MKNLNNISSELNSLASKLKSTRALTDRFIGNITFNYEEQELISRVLKSIFTQFKSSRDKETAKSILGKTRWIDG